MVDDVMKTVRYIVAILILIFVLAFVWFGTESARRDRVALQRACANNLEVIRGAKAVWAREMRVTTNATPTMADLAPYMDRGEPKCPAGGTYTIGPVGQNP